MPLTAELQARLAKRGLLKNKFPKGKCTLNLYVPQRNSVPHKGPGYEANAEPEPVGKSGCPNKWNPFHECNSYCIERWGEKVLSTLIISVSCMYYVYVLLTCAHIGNAEGDSSFTCQLEKSKR